jgi:hypothetical protein
MESPALDIIDKTIKDISGHTIVSTSEIVDILLDLRNIIETEAEKIEAEQPLVG